MSLNRARFWYVGRETIDCSFFGGFAIDFPQGAAELASNLDTVRNPDGIGTAVQQMTVSERTVTINGYIVGRPGAEYRRRLERAFAPLSSGRLWAETEEGARFWLDCISSAAPVIAGSRKYPRFQATATALYPYWQCEDETEIRLNGADGKLQNEVTIDSDAPVLYRLVFSAASGGAGFALGAGGEELRYTGAIGAGQMLELSADAGGRVTALLDGADVIGNVFGGLKKLPAGKAVWTLETPGGGTVTIYFREARAGV